MEKRTEYLFYIGIQDNDKDSRKENGEANKEKKQDKLVLPFYAGELVVYSCLVPGELLSPSEKLLRWQRKRQEKQRREALLARIKRKAEGVQTALNGERIDYFYAVPEIAGQLSEEAVLLHKNDIDELTDRLFTVCIYGERRKRTDTAFSVSLPQDCGELTVERLITIMKPYLPKLNHIIYAGDEEAGTEMLEDYLYDEYGMVMSYSRYPVRNTVWIDFGDGETKKLSKYAKENGICHINRAEVLKFLDTAAKNGYNTKVN